MEENTQPSQPMEPKEPVEEVSPEQSQAQPQQAQEQQLPQETSPAGDSQNQQEQTNAQPTGVAMADAKDVEDNRAITYLSYLGLLFLVPMLAKKESKFAQFHAKQGLVLAIAGFLGSFLMPLFGLGLLVYLAVFVLSIMGLISVSKGEMKELPLVGDFAKKFNF